MYVVVAMMIVRRAQRAWHSQHCRCLTPLRLECVFACRVVSCPLVLDFCTMQLDSKGRQLEQQAQSMELSGTAGTAMLLSRYAFCSGVCCISLVLSPAHSPFS
jgi:hypothetical protein